MFNSLNECSADVNMYADMYVDLSVTKHAERDRQGTSDALTAGVTAARAPTPADDVGALADSSADLRTSHRGSRSRGALVRSAAWDDRRRS
jgi:hypothetical protein